MDEWASPHIYPDGIRGWYTDRDVAALLRFARMANGVPGRILELGSFEGRSAVRLREAFPEREVTCVDLWPQEEYRAAFLSNTAGLRIDSLRMEWNDFKRDRRAAELRPIAIVHIDMLHTYEQVTDQIEWSRRMVEPGGMMVGHDYNPDAWPEVVRAVDEWTVGRLAEAHVWACRV